MMKELFKDGKYTAFGRREGASYTVEVRDQDGTPVAWRWFRDTDKTAGANVPAKFYDMIRKAVRVA